MTIDYKIKDIPFILALLDLEVDGGSSSGWGRFIQTENQGLIDFFNEFLEIERTEHSYVIGAYSDEAADYWDIECTCNEISALFDEIIKEAIQNTGMYKDFKNNFI